MTLLNVNNTNIVLCTGNKILLFDLKNEDISEIKLPALNIPAELSVNQQNALKNERSTIVTACFSTCGDYFAVCSLNKQLVVFNRAFQVCGNLNVCRGASKIRFAPNGAILLADKTGDVYLYELNNEHCQPKELLGHLSMLLDVVVSGCGKYIVTCDRDEKIRVSRFPNSYEIVSYCLGHEEFVTCMELLNEHVLISASGDGCVKLWNYRFGEELLTINTNDHVQDKSLLEQFVEFMDSETVEVNALPITNMKVKAIKGFTLAVISLYNYNSLQVYVVNNETEVNLLQIINLSSKLLCFDVTDTLYVLTEDNLVAYEFVNNCFTLKHCPGLNKFYHKYKNIVANHKEDDNISIFYKRKYDNMQEYQERKKVRLENQKK